MPHVFISHSTKNKTIADQLCAVLERNGLKCWIAPRDIPPGYPWAESIMTAIRESQLMLAVVSVDAHRSEQMAHELEGADTNTIPILPIRLDETPLTGQFGYFLGNKQWLDLSDRSPNDYESAVVQAVRTLQARWNGAAAERVEPTCLPQQGHTALRPAYRNEQPSRAVHTIVNELRDVIKTFVATVMRREKALAEFNLTDSRTLFFAFRILIYVSVATAILHIPAWSAQGIRFSHPAFLPLAVAGDLIEKIAFCFLLYTAMRLFGGRADPQQFFCAFCLLSVYQLLADICHAPIQIPAIAAQNHDVGEFFSGAFRMGDLVSVAGFAVLLIASTAWIAIEIVFVLSLFRAFHISEQLGVTRTAISFVVGIGAWILSVLVLSQPLEANLYAAFGGR